MTRPILCTLGIHRWRIIRTADGETRRYCRRPGCTRTDRIIRTLEASWWERTR